MENNYLEKLYGGFLGMNVGIRLGAPVEPGIWSYEFIKEVYGDIRDYVKEYKNFAADDDANGPVFFLRALYDDANGRELTPQDVARAWLNYTREGKGMFWWGGVGVSTEHTVFQNLKAGIGAPQSGSIAQNGQIMAEQIGGQIFIDTWGLVLPNDPQRAAQYGGYAASVSHDGDGMHGAQFFCAAISKAFSCNDIHEIVRCGLSYIPQDSTYYKVSQAVIDFHKNNPNDWEACRAMLEADFGYDKYLGVCHMIPNAGVCILAMVYGDGDFNRTVEIATMCGWDTDCNAGNVGTVLGVMCGIEGIAPHYRRPINDSIVLSSVSGYLNILDIPSYVRELALLGYRLAGEDAPQHLVDAHRPGEIYFDFELPGSTHNIRISDPFVTTLFHSDKVSYAGKGSLKILIDRIYQGYCSKVFYKPYYLRSDFSDERYQPVFSPTAYSGQTCSMKLLYKHYTGEQPVTLIPYVHLANQDSEICLDAIIPVDTGHWFDLTFTIPDSQGDLIDELGFKVVGTSPKAKKTLADLYLDEFTIAGDYDYSIDFAKQKINFGSVSPFAHNYGVWSLAGDQMTVETETTSESYAGNYYATDYSISTTVTPVAGHSHLMHIRSQGTQRGYWAGLTENNTVTLYKEYFGREILATAPFQWDCHTGYKMKLTAQGNQISLSIDNAVLLSTQDDSFGYGMYGCGQDAPGQTRFGNFQIASIK